MDKLVIATKNKGKLKEIKSILSEFEVVSMLDEGINIEIEENGATFEENSTIKAKQIFDLTKSCTLADDSGLEVEALDNMPGIYSARYAGDDESNNIKLLKNMENIENRKARFVCSIAFVDKNGKITTAYGYSEGEILREKRGDGGFGYDSLFYSYDLGKSFGEATEEEKNRVSHRYRALQNLKNLLEK